MIVNILCTYFLPHRLHKVQPIRLTDVLLGSVGIVYYLYVGRQGVSEVGDIVWKGLGFFFIFEQIGCKNSCLWNNVLVGRNVIR